MLSKKSKTKPARNLEFEALGTHWQIDASDYIGEDVANQIHQYLDRIDRTWSRFRADSTVADMARQAGIYTLTPDDHKLLSWYQSLYKATSGQVNPLVGQTLSDAGYDEKYSLKPRPSISKTPKWSQVIKLGPDGVTIKQPWLLDVGAAGKGFAVDQVAKLLNVTHASFTIDAGGDIYRHGKTEVVGLEHPIDPTKIIGTVHLKDASLCGSAINRRSWNGWHHIINPDTSQPASNIIATWVVAETAMQADGLATALFFTEPDKLASLGDFLYVIIHANGQISYSNNQQIEIFK